LTPTVQATLQALPHLHGLPISPDTFHSKVVIVTFFASWCPPCREEFAHLQALHTQYQEEGVTIIAVNLFEDFDQFSDDKRLTAFLDKTKPPFTVLKGNEMISQQFGTITRIPSLFIFDRQGQQAGAFRNEGDDAQTTLDVAALRRLVTTLL
jgi:cytochrome c biogenesis protein CcmG/thiol:disulfide interchange protein DsbE